MNKNTTYLILGLGVLAVIAFFGYRTLSSQAPVARAPETAPLVTESPAASTPATTNTFTLNEQNTSGQSGTATLTEVSGKVMVTISLVGELATASEPAHIHLGACPEPGAVKFPLTNVVGGKSETTIATTLAELKTMGPLAINIHESQAKLTNYLTCGDLVF